MKDKIRYSVDAMRMRNQDMENIAMHQEAVRIQGMKHETGSSMTEFLIVTPLLLFMGLGIMQIGLVYHAKSMLNYATFEAARVGATNNGQIYKMVQELGYRMAPVFGGDGTLADGVSAITRASVAVRDPSATKVEILHPSPASFAEHGESKNVEGNAGARNVTAIPNSHLRMRDQDEILSDGMNIQDANLLKIKVTYGYQVRLPYLDVELPGVRSILRTMMIQADQDNWMYYVRGMLPIESTALVRMQSEAWLEQEQSPEGRMFDALYEWTEQQVNAFLNGEDSEGGPDDLFPEQCDANGVPENSDIDEVDEHECNQLTAVEPEDGTAAC